MDNRPCAGRVRSPIYILLCAFLTLALGLGSCTAKKNAESRLYLMGQRVEAGSLIYSVLEAEWDPNLGPARFPTHRFVLLRLSVTNSGAEAAMVPPMQLIAPNGQSFSELADGAGVTDWLGSLRKLDPAETMHGRILFDAPRADYKLRVADDAENPDDAIVALIEIPLRFESRDRLVSPPAEAP